MNSSETTVIREAGLPAQRALQSGERNGCLTALSSTGAKLIITVDTEEEGLWHGRYRTTGNTVENINGVPRFQGLCDQLRIRPTYLVDAPVVEDERASEILGEIHVSGRCEIGGHVHPWCNPPFDAHWDERESYLCNLPVALQSAKIRWLTEAIADRFGKPPRSFRAGRYGLDAEGARILAGLGYEVDSSVIPFTDYSSGGGPDFRSAPWQPYWLGGDDICSPQESGTLLEVPVTVGFNRSNFPAAMRLQTALGRSPFRWFRAEGMLDRSGLLRRTKLSPEQADTSRMKALVDRCCETPGAVLVMMFHSSSLRPGLSPYVRDESSLDVFLERIRETCQYCLNQKSAAPATLCELVHHGVPA